MRGEGEKAFGGGEMLDDSSHYLSSIPFAGNGP